MNQWNRLIQESDLQNPLRLSQSVLELLAQEVDRYQTLEKSLPSRILRYLVDGDDERVLRDIEAAIVQQTQQVLTTQSFWAGWQSGTSDRARQALFKALPVADAGFYCRLAQLYSVESNAAHASQTAIRFGATAWFDPFLRALAQTISYDYYGYYKGRSKVNLKFSIAQVEAMFAEVNEPAESLIELVYSSDPDNWNLHYLIPIVAGLEGFADFTLKHGKLLQGALTHPQNLNRSHALRMMVLVGVPVEPFLDRVVDRAISSAKSEREIAIELVRSVSEQAIPYVKQRIQSGKADDRLYGVQLLQMLEGDRAREFLEMLLQTEKAAKVREAIEKILNPVVFDTTVESISYQLPELPEITLDLPLDGAVRSEFETLFTISKQSTQAAVKHLLNYLDSQSTQEQINNVLNHIKSWIPNHLVKQIKTDSKNLSDWKLSVQEVLSEAIDQHQEKVWQTLQTGKKIAVSTAILIMLVIKTGNAGNDKCLSLSNSRKFN
ncbi:MAG: hypothetical protein HC936_04675 [Leptolyngbyaceae cyanobacterium SU_3_3]|nr:hypothetical protein [Leptolyngbyaceae cyanobacterium SU_3_3]